MRLSAHCLFPLTACLGCDPALAATEHAATMAVSATSAGSAPTPGTRRSASVPTSASRAPTPPRPETQRDDRRDDGAKPRLDAYPWHSDETLTPLDAVDTLERRFAPPDGFRRVDTSGGSFGAWLRELPLAAPGTPVRSYSGGVLLPPSDPRIAAVSTLDTGSADLQQCADAVMRLHAEWLWSRGRAGDASYASGGGPIPWGRYLAGGTPTLSGNTFVWKARSPRTNVHATYRRYLDVVFSWASTLSLQSSARSVARGDVTAGDFFVLGGSPGHAVLVLDVAKDAHGRRVALLGQSYMPAQSFQVLRPATDGAWFTLDDERGVETPFWRRFPWSSLRRLPG